MIAQVWILGTGHTVSRGSVLFFPGAHEGRAGGWYGALAPGCASSIDS